MALRNESYQRVGRAIDRLILWIAGVALVLMMVHISADVVATLVIGAPLVLTNTIVTYYYMIAIAYLPLAAGELRSAHISVDLVVNVLPARIRGIVDALMQLLAIAVYGALALQAWQVAMEKLDRDAYLMEQATRVSTWPSYFVIPVGFSLIAILLAARVVCRVLGLPELRARSITDEITHV